MSKWYLVMRPHEVRRLTVIQHFLEGKRKANHTWVRVSSGGVKFVVPN
ncbi:Integrase catalytic region [Alicyclobacillus hesperidum URH17-3-68]|nr:Integrase catalytic region [Alicyclobacillus hesperidum URH17-3-68]